MTNSAILVIFYSRKMYFLSKMRIYVHVDLNSSKQEVKEKALSYLVYSSIRFKTETANSN